MSAVALKRRDSKGMSGHQRPHHGASDVWLTPPEILNALGPFDLDPCSPIGRPWDTAARHFTEADDGLSKAWAGRVWLNPPYGAEAETWLSRLADHGNGVALVFARTETRWFHRFAWERAGGMLFLEGRLHFHRIDGVRADFNAGAPSVLIAYGVENVASLRGCGLKGKLVELS